MPGILIDFQEAKEKLTATRSTPVSADLDDAVSMFAFSRLQKRNRVALILAGIYGGDAETHLVNADQILHYASKDFAVPFKVVVSEA